MLRLLSPFALLPALLACGEPAAGPPPNFDVSVASDQPTYVLARDSLAYATLTNASTAPVYLPMDSYVVYERLTDGEWRNPFAWFVVDGVGRSFPVRPSESRTDVLRLWFYLHDRPGTYRFRYFVYADPDLRSLLPLDERVSPTFVISP